MARKFFETARGQKKLAILALRGWTDWPKEKLLRHKNTFRASQSLNSALCRASLWKRQKIRSSWFEIFDREKGTKDVISIYDACFIKLLFIYKLIFTSIKRKLLFNVLVIRKNIGLKKGTKVDRKDENKLRNIEFQQEQALAGLESLK